MAKALAAGGAAIIVNVRSNKSEADQVVREIERDGGKAIPAVADVGDTIRQLQQYDFVDRQAKADFAALVQSLQQQALDSLPLVQAGLIHFDVIPLVPYPGFMRLFGR